MNLRIKLTEQNAKNKIIISIIIFLVLCLILIYLIIKPNINQIKYLKKSIIDQKIQAEQYLNRQKNMSSVSRNIKQIEPQADELNAVYINKNKELEFITTLEGIASRNNVSQTINLSIESAKNNKDYQIIPLTLNVSGTFNDLLDYLIDVETLKFYINIHSFSLSSANKQQAPPGTDLPAVTTYSLTLLANTYWK